MSVVDANVILRYVLNDHAELSPKAAEILEQQTATLPIEVACEVVYVLQNYKKYMPLSAKIFNNSLAICCMKT